MSLIIVVAMLVIVVLAKEQTQRFTGLMVIPQRALQPASGQQHFVMLSQFYSKWDL
ncbi:hypothetical protein O0V09_07500 [Dasania sp. GY-19]|uniref:Uncharacterized protein n=1 Tax=Dasania phycosphaerae TaxID=2950436 RepID=A0A9J6RK19_9GAMM|nr:hypothetical protein [Dasania phycosphaerae]MCZ0865038.1 hypothetical protein [Dasania phycosphaerae]